MSLANEQSTERSCRLLNTRTVFALLMLQMGPMLVMVVALMVMSVISDVEIEGGRLLRGASLIFR